MQESQVVPFWQGIKDWFANYLPEALETLNPGVDSAAFDAFSREVEQKTDQPLPEAMKTLYGQNDGQQSGSTGVFLGLEFLSLEGVREQWQSWCGFAEGEGYADLDEPCSSFPQDAIQSRYACLGWIPLAYDWSGNHFGIDLAPGATGQVGQIINFGADEAHKFVLAPSLEAYLAWQLAHFQKGNVRIVTETFGETPERHIELRSPPNAHLLDAVPEIFGPEQR